MYPRLSVAACALRRPRWVIPSPSSGDVRRPHALKTNPFRFEFHICRLLKRIEYHCSLSHCDKGRDNHSNQEATHHCHPNKIPTRCVGSRKNNRRRLKKSAPRRFTLPTFALSRAFGVSLFWVKCVQFTMGLGFFRLFVVLVARSRTAFKFFRGEFLRHRQSPFAFSTRRERLD